MFVEFMMRKTKYSKESDELYLTSAGGKKFWQSTKIDDIAFKKKQVHSGRWGLSTETISLFYDMIIFPVGFFICLTPCQYHNALQKAQMRYRLLEFFDNFGGNLFF